MGRGGSARATDKSERARGSPRGPDGATAKRRGGSGVVATKGGSMWDRGDVGQEGVGGVERGGMRAADGPSGA